MEGKEITEMDMDMLLHFFNEIVGCVNSTWEEKLLKGASRYVTTSDEDFAFLL